MNVCNCEYPNYLVILNATDFKVHDKNYSFRYITNIPTVPHYFKLFYIVVARVGLERIFDLAIRILGYLLLLSHKFIKQ